MVTVHCPCGRASQVPAGVVGRRVRCPCGTIFRARPIASVVAASVPPPPPPVSAGKKKSRIPRWLLNWEGLRQEVPVSDQGGSVRCPYCLEQLVPPPDRSLACPHCGSGIVFRQG